MKILILLISFFLIKCPAIDRHTKENPVEIYAEDSIEWHKNEKKYLAQETLEPSSGSMSLTSDRIEAFYDEKEESDMDIKLIKAHNKVVITDKKLKIVGGKLAEYNLKKDYFSIFGQKLLLTSENNRLKSNNKMEYWRQKGIAIATGNATTIKGTEFIIKSEKLVWYVDEVEEKMNVKKILGFNNVSIRTNNEVAFSDKALYNKENGICKLFGNVKLQRCKFFNW